jgi:hypothetical protein
MLIHKLTIFIVILFLSTCTSPEPTQTGSDISTNAPKEINWEKAKHLIFTGEVETIVQSHDLNVILQLEDGRQFISTEPELDSVVQILQECGARCSNTSMMTE